MPVSKTPPEPVVKIVSVSGDALVVQLRPLVGTQSDVVFSISRNGVREEKFTILELGQVLQIANTQLALARGHALNVKQP